MQNQKRLPGALGFAIVFVGLSALLLTQLGGQTKFSSSGQLFAQPRFWPAVSILGMLIFGGAYLISVWRQARPKTSFDAASWLGAFEYLIWFMVYVWIVPIIGYLLATMIFTTALAFRQGYRNTQKLALAAALGLVIVLTFKTGLSVKIPGGEVYEYLPDGLRNFMIVNF